MCCWFVNKGTDAWGAWCLARISVHACACVLCEFLCVCTFSALNLSLCVFVLVCLTVHVCVCVCVCVAQCSEHGEVC